MKQPRKAIFFVTTAAMLYSFQLSAQDIQIDNQVYVIPVDGITGSPAPGNPNNSPDTFNYQFNALVTSIPDPSAGSPGSPAGPPAGGSYPPDPDPVAVPGVDHCETGTTVGDELVMFPPNSQTPFRRNPEMGRWGNTFRPSAILNGVPYQYIESARISYSPGGDSVFGELLSVPVDTSPWAITDAHTIGTDLDGNPYQGDTFLWAATWVVRCADGSTKSFSHDGEAIPMMPTHSNWRYTHKVPAEGFQDQAIYVIDSHKQQCVSAALPLANNHGIDFDPVSGLIPSEVIDDLVGSFSFSFQLNQGQVDTYPYGVGEIVAAEAHRFVFFSRDEFDWLGTMTGPQTEYVIEKQLVAAFIPGSREQQVHAGCDPDAVSYSIAFTSPQILSQ